MTPSEPPSPVPDPRIRGSLHFGCGAALGVIAGVYYAARWFDDGWSALVTVVTFGLLVGWLARRYGEAFWDGVVRTATWWR